MKIHQFGLFFDSSASQRIHNVGFGQVAEFDLSLGFSRELSLRAF
jgi:hypothetical protein